MSGQAFDPEVFRTRMLQVADCCFAELPGLIMFPPDARSDGAIAGLVVQRTERALDLTRLLDLLQYSASDGSTCFSVEAEVTKLHGDVSTAAKFMQWQQSKAALEGLFLEKFKALFRQTIDVIAVCAEGDAEGDHVSQRYSSKLIDELLPGILRVLYEYSPADQRITAAQSAIATFVNEYSGSGEGLVPVIQKIGECVTHIAQELNGVWFSAQAVHSLAVKTVDLGLTAKAWLAVVGALGLRVDDAYHALKSAWLNDIGQIWSSGEVSEYRKYVALNRFKMLRALDQPDADNALAELISTIRDTATTSTNPRIESFIEALREMGREEEIESCGSMGDQPGSGALVTADSPDISAFAGEKGPSGGWLPRLWGKFVAFTHR